MRHFVLGEKLGGQVFKLIFSGTDYEPNSYIFSYLEKHNNSPQ